MQTKAMGCCMMCAGGACCLALANVVMSRETQQRRVSQLRDCLRCRRPADTVAIEEDASTGLLATAAPLLSPSGNGGAGPAAADSKGNGASGGAGPSGGANGHGHSHGGVPCDGHHGGGGGGPRPLTDDENKYLDLMQEVRKFSACAGKERAAVLCTRVYR
jgi:hypothetical protein